MRFFILLSCLFVLTSCTVMNVGYKIPTTHFITAETQGKQGSFYTQAQIPSAHRVSVAEAYDDIFSDAVRLNDENDIYTTFSLGADLYAGIFKRLDLIGSFNGDSPLKVGVKYQLIGEPEAEQAKGFKLSIASLFGSISQDEKVELKGSRGNTKDTVEGKTDVTSHELHLIPGYRVTKDVLFYLDGFYQKYNAEAELISKNNGTKTLDHFSQNHGINSGIRVSTNKNTQTRPEQLHFGGQLGWAKTYAMGEEFESKTLGASLGINW